LRRLFQKAAKEIDTHPAAGLDVHIIMDNYATHKTGRVKAGLPMEVATFILICTILNKLEK
jgi:hypothetical protein